MNHLEAGRRAFDCVPDAPGRWPLFGHLPRLSRDLPDLMRSMAASGPRLQRLRLPFSFDIHVWAHSDSIRLLQSPEVSSAHVISLGEVVLGRLSMLSSDGDAHRRRRTASDRPFTPRGLNQSGISAVIGEVVSAWAERLVQRDEVLLLAETQVLALEIIFRVMGVPQDELAEWAQAYTTMLKSVLGPSWSIPGFPYHRARKARRWVDARLLAFIQRSRESSTSTGLVAELVRGRDEQGQALSDQEILDNLRLMIFAGHETTASVMAWSASYLALRPELFQAIREEARTLEGLPQTPRELRTYRYAEGLFREVLRVHPPVVLTTRKVLVPMEIGGFSVPEGAILGVPVWMFGRDAEQYPDPDRFDPARWLGERRKLSAMENIAFGGGPHFCLGYHMAWLEVVQCVVALTRALEAAGRRMEMKALPGETYLPLLRPRLAETRCSFVSTATP